MFPVSRDWTTPGAAARAARAACAPGRARPCRRISPSLAARASASATLKAGRWASPSSSWRARNSRAISWSVRPAISTSVSAARSGARPATTSNASLKASRPSWPVSTSVPSMSHSTSRRNEPPSCVTCSGIEVDTNRQVGPYHCAAPVGDGHARNLALDLEVAVAEGRVLAIDLGTSSVRALVFEQDGHAGARALRPASPGVLARRPSGLRVDDDGAAELDPDGMVEAVGACLDELAGGDELDGVETVALSCAWHTVLAVDPRGRPLSAVLTWVDTRAAALVGELARRADPARLHAETGAPLH